MPPTLNRAMPAALLALTLMPILWPLTGCGYTLRTPHDPAIRTIYVPIAQSATFRRDLNFKLTEAVKKEIETRTPYKVVGSPEGADAVLSMYIRFNDKNLMVQNPQNLPRHLTATMAVEAKWIDNRPDAESVPADFVAPIAYFYPEIGETAELGFEKVIDKIARAVVDKMEAAW